MRLVDGLDPPNELAIRKYRDGHAQVLLLLDHEAVDLYGHAIEFDFRRIDASEKSLGITPLVSGGRAIFVIR